MLALDDAFGAKALTVLMNCKYAKATPSHRSPKLTMAEWLQPLWRAANVRSNPGSESNELCGPNQVTQHL